MTSLGLMSYKAIQSRNEVLSVQDERFLKEREEKERERWLEQEIYYYNTVMGIRESTESTSSKESE